MLEGQAYFLMLNVSFNVSCMYIVASSKTLQLNIVEFIAAVVEGLKRSSLYYRGTF